MMPLLQRRRAYACLGTPRRADARGDDGTATAFLVVIVVALLACAGLVVDGGAALRARVRTATVAQEAARSGAEQLDLVTFRTSGTVRLQPTAAAAAARAYVAATAAADPRVQLRLTAVSVSATRVSVTVEADQPAGLLTLVGLTSLHVRADAAASALTAPEALP